MTGKRKREEVESDLTQKEAEEARDTILKRMLSTPPKPRRDEPKRGKAKKDATR